MVMQTIQAYSGDGKNKTGAIGTNDNDVVYDTNDYTDELDLGNYNTHYIECIAGTIDVDVSIDGINWIAAIAGISLVTTTPATRVVEAASGVCIVITGSFERLRVNQKGATASNARIRHASI